ncbi:MAG: hypothetical protein AAGN35_06050 [Bacteroidota bacterium]
METRVERKCDSCGKWVKGDLRKCPFCFKHVDHRKRDEERAEIAKIEKKARDQAEFDLKPPFTRTVIRIGQAIETIFMAITGAIAATLFWLGG